VLTSLGDKDPRQIGPYRIQGLLGRGGMGAVYLGFSPDDRSVAVKVPAPALASDEQFRARFRREVAAARRVHGRAVAAVLDADTSGDRPWMATEYVEGKSLAEAVSERGQLDERLLTGLAIGLAEALVAIHDVGVVHRDLKPANIVLSWDGPRVIDFGVASASDTTQHTSTGVLIGTIVWMAPEQLRGERAGPPADIFAWGACVAYAATGRPPFGAPTPEAVGLRILSAVPELGGVPAALLPIVRAALEKDPARRPTAAQLRDRLLRGGAVEELLGDTTTAAETERITTGDDRYGTALARLWELPPGTPPPPPPGRRHEQTPPYHPAAADSGPAYSDRAYSDPGYSGPGRAYATAGGRDVQGDPGYRGPGHPGAGGARPPARAGGRRGATVALVVVVLLVALGGAAAAAIALANRGGTGPDTASTSGPATGGSRDAGPGTAIATVGGKPGVPGDPASTPGQASASPRRLTSQDVAATVRAKGYTPNLATFDANRALNVVIGSRTIRGGGADGGDVLAEEAFVFTDTDFLGTDTREPSRQIKVVATTDAYAVLEYGIFDVDDADCCPSRTARVRYNWDGHRFTPQNPDGIPPADPGVDGSRR